MGKLVGIAAIAGVGIWVASLSDHPRTLSPTAPQAQAALAAARTAMPSAAPTAQAVPETDLSNHRFYTNSSGNTVHAPARTLSGAVPFSASAICADGTYSFSQRHRGTCSHHGAVSRWR